MIKTYDLNKNNIKDFLISLNKINQMDSASILSGVDEIVKRVRAQGDSALIELTRQFDKVELTIENIEIKQSELDLAYESIPKRLLEIMKNAAKNIEDYQKKQILESWYDEKADKSVLGRKVTPLENVGVYVPGGSAPLPSSVLMNIIPAKVAGVNNIIMCTPPGKDGNVNQTILAAAKIAGANRVFRIGGAQAIAAMAFGTDTIPKVDKIVGPGNIYVSMAKKLVYGYCDIDMFAGPSDILIIADNDIENKIIAADFLSQAEHDKLSKSIAIVFDAQKAKELSVEIQKQLINLPRKEIAQQSVEDNGLILIAENMDIAIELTNGIAPEHLEIMVEQPFKILDKIKNAGAIFLGKYSPEPIGDYYAGPSHVLPTNGSAKFFSPLGVEEFLKRSSVIYYSKEAFQKCADEVIDFALAEGLDAHANAIKVRS